MNTVFEAARGERKERNLFLNTKVMLILFNRISHDNGRIAEMYITIGNYGS